MHNFNNLNEMAWIMRLVDVIRVSASTIVAENARGTSDFHTRGFKVDAFHRLCAKLIDGQ